MNSKRSTPPKNKRAQRIRLRNSILLSFNLPHGLIQDLTDKYYGLTLDEYYKLQEEEAKDPTLRDRYREEALRDYNNYYNNE